MMEIGPGSTKLGETLLLLLLGIDIDIDIVAQQEFFKS
jgi:hypothetical protein